MFLVSGIINRSCPWEFKSGPGSQMMSFSEARSHRIPQTASSSSSSELSEGLLKNMAIIRMGIKTNWGRTEFWLRQCFFCSIKQRNFIERPGETGPWTSPCLPGGNENKIWSDHSETTAPTKKKQKDMGTFKFLHKTSVYLGRGGTWFICICNAKIHACFQNWAFRLLIFPKMQEN